MREAAKYFKMSADQDYLEGQVHYGYCLYNGEGVVKNYAEAAIYFRIAAEYGSVTGLYNYGNCLYEGHGVSLNLSEAATCFKIAADQGHAGAQCNYGICLEKGEGVCADLVQAAKYYKMSADQGHPYGQNHYALCLERGEGVTKNLIEAAKYYKQAMKQGNKHAREAFHRCVEITVWGMIMNFSDCEIEQRLGKGRFGPTDLAKRDKTEERFALKFFEVCQRFRRNRFMREGSFLRSVRHPCVSRIVGWCLPDSASPEARIATVYLPHGSLEDLLSRIRKNGPPSFWTHSKISTTIVGILLGMKYLHSRNIVHGALSPSNILLDENYMVKISDYGLCKLWRSGIMMVRENISIYAAPEMFSSGKITRKSDVFSFGLILYELLTGKSVFPRDASVVRNAQLHESPIRPEIPAFVARVTARLIERCWAKDPEVRPSFRDIYDNLSENYFPFFKDVPRSVIEDFVTEMVRREDHPTKYE
jgi:hypothetical protein